MQHLPMLVGQTYFRERKLVGPRFFRCNDYRDGVITDESFGGCLYKCKWVESLTVFEWFKLSANSERRSPSVTVSTSLLAVPSVFSFNSSSEFSSPANLYPHSKILIIA